MKYFSTEYFDELQNISISYGIKNYEYYFLSQMHRHNRDEGASVIIVGSSYGMDGVKVSGLTRGRKNVINFSIQSQDLYYDYVNIKKAVAEGKKTIRKCIIAPGYYALYQDLSLSERESRWIRKAYEPLWNDTHHLPPSEHYHNSLEGVSYDNSMYDADMLLKFCDSWLRGVVAESGFDLLGGLIERVEITPWQDVLEEQKIVRAREQAEAHNRLYRFKDTCVENKKILYDMMEYLVCCDIVPIVVFSPSTKQYFREMPFRIVLLDMNDINGFIEDDFHDCDHLSDKGAERATKLLDWVLGEI